MSYYLETERLLLRRINDADLSILIDMLGNPRVMRWLFSGLHMDRDSARSFIEREFTFGDESIGLGALCEKTPERCIGFAGILPCNYLDMEDFEFGVALQEDSWNKGYAREIGEAQIRHGFQKLRVDRLLALAHPQNTASLKVLEKMGMRLVKEILTEQRGPRRVYVLERSA